MTFGISSHLPASGGKHNTLSFQTASPSYSIRLAKFDYIKDIIKRCTISTERKGHYFSEGENKVTQATASITTGDPHSLIRTPEK